ncbi:MAG: spore germination protein [Clostridia bacterium]|nr:spore germination protein [Clostridia bacterium]
MKINVRQICFIMIAYTAVTKLLLYPTTLADFCGRDILIPALINFLIEGIIIWGVSFLCSRTDKTFYELLKSNLGNVGAKIIFGLFTAYFLFVTIIPVFEQKLYVHTIFYDTVPSLGVFLPFFIFAVYAGSRNFENLGRTADICLPVFIATLAGLMFMSFGTVQWDNLFPMLQTSALTLFKGAAGTAFRFMEPCWLLMFMGHFKYKKGDAAKITLSYAGGALIVLLFLAVFYGMYGGITSSRTFAISRTSIFFSAIESIGRIDLILLYALEVVMLFALALNIQLAVYTMSKTTGYENANIWSLAVNLILFIILAVCDHYFHSIQQFFFRWAWIAFIIFSMAIPSLVWTLRRKNER